jgi:hypothetical protein
MLETGMCVCQGETFDPVLGCARKRRLAAMGQEETHLAWVYIGHITPCLTHFAALD